MATYTCIDCPHLEGASASAGRYHADANNHCVVRDEDDE